LGTWPTLSFPYELLFKHWHDIKNESHFFFI
jgi:hypothetical protein